MNKRKKKKEQQRQDRIQYARDLHTRMDVVLSDPSFNLKEEALANKIDDAIKNTPEFGNPFKGISFTEEDREILAQAGCV